MSSAIYSALDPSNHEIRTILIKPPNRDTDQVECTLHIQSLDSDTTPYEALSYCWGSSSNPLKILLDGVETQVTDNLHQALLHFRKIGVGNELPIWIDALCINQADVGERGSQVGMMRQIYKTALRVHIWLGGPEQVTKEGMQALRELNEAPTYFKGERRILIPHVFPEDNSLFDGGDLWPRFHTPSNLSKLRALATIARNPYWQRTWILQEAALAVRCTVHGNDESVVVLGIENHMPASSASPIFHPLNWINVRTTAESTDPLAVEAKEAFYSVCTAGFAQVLAPAGLGDDQSFRRTFQALFKEFRTSNASDPRDKIFGLLGLMPMELNIKPDYSKSMREVYIQATVELIRFSRDLDLLVGACSGAVELPSWVPDFRAPPRLKYFHDEMLRLGAATSYAQAEGVVVSEEGVLTVQGVELDHVVAVDRGCTHRSDDWGAVARHLLARRRLFSQHASSTPPDTDGADDLPPDYAFYRAALGGLILSNGLDQRLTREDVPHLQHASACIRTLASSFSSSSSQQSDSYTHFPDQDALDTLTRSLTDLDFFTTSTGLAGAVPASCASVGDSILILAGAPGPFCAKRVRTNDTVAGSEREAGSGLDDAVVGFSLGEEKRERYILASPCFVESSGLEGDSVDGREIMRGGAVLALAGLPGFSTDGLFDEEFRAAEDAVTRAVAGVWEEVELV
jgi:hypothetical protein